MTCEVTNLEWRRQASKSESVSAEAGDDPVAGSHDLNVCILWDESQMCVSLDLADNCGCKL
jgi:hypothetical protein